MMKRTRASFLLWVVAVILSLGVAVFQRLTGPTWPVRGSVTLGGAAVHFRFLRSHTAGSPLPVRVQTDQSGLNLTLVYRRHPSNEAWRRAVMHRVSDGYLAHIPGQPPAGKVAYRVEIGPPGAERPLLPGAVEARFKGRVPAVWLILHICFMLAGIVLCVRTGLESLRREPRLGRLVNTTLGAVALGGLIFGPVVQKFAFGDFWTGFPLGTDLTDNKTLLAFLFWLAAFWLYRRSRWWVFAAAVLMLAVSLVPHSLGGSELDYTSGTLRNKFSLSLSHGAPIRVEPCPGLRRMPPRDDLSA